MIDEIPTLPSPLTCVQLPELPEVADIDPIQQLMMEFLEFPPLPIERARIIIRPKTIEPKLLQGKPPSPLKPKPLSKIINTIALPMKMRNVPFKPIGDPRSGQLAQSPPRKQRPKFSINKPA